MQNRKRQDSRKSNPFFATPLATVLTCMLAFLAVGLFIKCVVDLVDAIPENPSISASTTETADTVPGAITVVSSATISSQGDLLMHKPVIETCKDEDGNYDFSSIFRYVKDYIAGYDYAVANFETTLGGPNHPYQGNPTFNTPDAFADDLVDTGYDMLLTANNHCADTTASGIVRTLEQLRNRNLATVGTQKDAGEQDFLVIEVEGIRLGISCYTFQPLSYTIDVYRGEAKVQKSFVRLATYVALFPQLIAGPIVRYTTVEEDLSSRTHSFENFSCGATRFVLGLAKKVLIADRLGDLIASFHASDEKSVVFYWIYAFAVFLQLYFDFSGYSDMAIGLGRIFGFRFLENFNYPIISKRIGEFWRRWHMSLGTWFRDYVYIPLGGNRVSKWRWLFNTLVVWMLTGFWHGADWSFILWGLYFAIFLVLEKFVLNKFFAKIPRVFSHLYVVLVILISFVLFSANGMAGAIADIGGMFGAGNLPFWTRETGYYLAGYAVLLVAACIGATPLLKTAVLKLKEKSRIANNVINVLEPIVVVALLLVITSYFVGGSFSAFLYFRF